MNVVSSITLFQYALKKFHTFGSFYTCNVTVKIIEVILTTFFNCYLTLIKTIFGKFLSIFHAMRIIFIQEKKRYVYTILWRNLWAPPFLYHVIGRHWGADNSKLVHYSVLRLHVYFWFFYLTNICFFTAFWRPKITITCYDKTSLLSSVSILMTTNYNSTFEQREITLRIALRRIMLY